MDSPSQQNLNQLPVGTALGDFKITGVIGEGGFGIVYLAYEPTLDRTVAIKEYLPSSIAGRTGNQSVMVRSQLNSNAFASGLKNFLREAQMLARFSHPALVEVHRVWEQNSTAYMAMRYYPGKTLRELRASTADFDEASIRRLLEPVFDALSLLHAQNVIHRDVSPDNILLRGNGAPVLLDLGAARLVIGGMTQALTTVLKPGYAPIEQYVDDGTMHQGPWTDVYGLGAVLYYLLVGTPPPQAVARMITDPLKDLAGKATVEVPQHFLDAVVKALAVRPENRYQSIEELRDALGWTGEIQVEPRTTFVSLDPNAPPVHIGHSLRTGGGLAAAGGAVTGARTGGASPRSGQPAAAGAAQPIVLDKVFTQDADATVVWRGPPVTLPPPAVSPPPLPPSPPASRSGGRRASDPPASGPALPRAKSYAEASGGGSKTWIAVAVAAVLAAGGGYYYMTRTPMPPPAAQDVATPASPPVAATPSPAAAPAPVASVATSPPPAPAPAPAAAAPAPAPVSLPPAVKPPVESKPGPDKQAKDAEELVKKRDAEDKAAKLKAEVADKAAKAKAELDERAKIRARIEAEEKAAATARAEQEERARRAKQEEDDRIAKAKQEADAAAKAAAATPSGGLSVRRSVDDLSSAGAAAFKRGDVAAARAAWNELVNHPDATARSKAIAYNNLAVSYCQASDEATCERMYASMFRSDRNYGMEVSEREVPAFKRAYDRAARAARARY